MAAYYNEIDPYGAEWLRNLIKAGHIADGEVDERSIVDVRPGDLAGFAQCHFFAGIGVWSYALRLAGWGDDRSIWTGSCPCQPFSAAGKGKGFDDERHLWPVFHRLIAECRPPIVVGEQVASADGLVWLDAVHADLEDAGYAAGAADMCAAGVGAPHIRQRLWWVGKRLADANGGIEHGGRDAGQGRRPERTDGGGDGRLAEPGSERREGVEVHIQSGGPQPPGAEAPGSGGHGRMADDEGDGRGKERPDAGGGSLGNRAEGVAAGSGAGVGDLRPGPTDGFWRDADWLFCRDGRWRPVEPGTFPLAHGAPSRMGRLRAYGNAIVPQVAATFVKAVMEVA